MEKLVKNALGQWNIIKEVLRKAPDSPSNPVQPLQPEASTPAVAAAPTTAAPNFKSYNDLKPQLHEMFKKIDPKAGTDNHINKEIHKNIKDSLNALPKGEVDLGDLGDMHQSYAKDGFRLPHNDLGTIISHHAGNARNLKEIYDKHGGIKAIETLARTMGVNGTPLHYAMSNQSGGLKLKPNTYVDLLDLVNPGKGYSDRKDHKHLGVLPKSRYQDTPGHIVKKHQKNVNDTYDKIMDHEDGWSNKEAVDKHEDAVIARTLDLFKHHNDLK